MSNPSKLYRVEIVTRSTYFIEATDRVDAEEIGNELYGYDFVVDRLDEAEEHVSDTLEEWPTNEIDEDAYWIIYRDGSRIDMR